MSGRGFLALERVIVPSSLADYANQHLRRVGLQGYEGFALWAGKQEGSLFTVTECIIPVQSGMRYEDGVCVRVDGDELFRINVHLYRSGLQLIAQLHSHPTDAYHSETDDTFPIATTAGALSLVIPDFAARPFELSRCAVYRLIPSLGWVGLSPAEVARLVQIVSDACGKT